MNQLKTYFIPHSFKIHIPKEEEVIVVIDVLRATTAITSALYHGARCVIPVRDVEQLETYKAQDYLIASERKGVTMAISNFSNSPLEFIKNDVKDKEIVFSTSNGTRAIDAAKDASQTILACFSNIQIVSDYLSQQSKPICILCSGWLGHFSLEDTLCAGAIIEQLISKKEHLNLNDSSTAALDLWNIAKANLQAYKEKCTHRHRLKELGMEESVEFCFQLNTMPIIPIIRNQEIVKLKI